MSATLKLLLFCSVTITYSLLTTASLAAPVTVKVRFLPSKELKETILPDSKALKDIVRVAAKADSTSGIEKVTFEIDEQFRAETKKAPFRFDWDTLAEQDGDHTLSVTAVNVNGQSGQTRLKVRVLNELSL